MKENTPTTYTRLRFVVEVEISIEDAAAILKDKRMGGVGISPEEYQYSLEAIDEIAAGEFTSYVLNPTHKLKLNTSTMKYEKVLNA
jgi:hypothetical protein